MMKNYDYIPFEKLNGKNILITGACGLIGSAVIDFLMDNKVNCNIYALARNRSKIEKRFSSYLKSPLFHIVEGDINVPLMQILLFITS